MSVYVMALSFIVATYNSGSAAYSFGRALFTAQSEVNALGYGPAPRISLCPPDHSAACTYTYKAVQVFSAEDRAAVVVVVVRVVGPGVVTRPPCVSLGSILLQGLLLL